jgi:hypothetical protein
MISETECERIQGALIQEILTSEEWRRINLALMSNPELIKVLPFLCSSSLTDTKRVCKSNKTCPCFGA